MAQTTPQTAGYKKGVAAALAAGLQPDKLIPWDRRYHHGHAVLDKVKGNLYVKYTTTLSGKEPVGHILWWLVGSVKANPYRYSEDKIGNVLKASSGFISIHPFNDHETGRSYGLKSGSADAEYIAEVMFMPPKTRRQVRWYDHGYYQVSDAKKGWIDA